MVPDAVGIQAGIAAGQAMRPHEARLAALEGSVKTTPFEDARPGGATSLEARVADLERRLAAAGVP